MEMSFFELLLILLWLFFLIGVKRVFLYHNKKLRTQHVEEMGLLQLSFEMHKKQRNERQTHLNTYNFLTYNLEEALLVQPKIKL